MALNHVCIQQHKNGSGHLKLVYLIWSNNYTSSVVNVTL